MRCLRFRVRADKYMVILCNKESKRKTSTVDEPASDKVFTYELKCYFAVKKKMNLMEVKMVTNFTGPEFGTQFTNSLHTRANEKKKRTQNNRIFVDCIKDG